MQFLLHSDISETDKAAIRCTQEGGIAAGAANVSASKHASKLSAAWKNLPGAQQDIAPFTQFDFQVQRTKRGREMANVLSSLSGTEVKYGLQEFRPMLG